MPARSTTRFRTLKASLLGSCTRRPALIAGAAAAMSCSQAHATWSILITDTRTGEIVVGSATCITSFDLARETPVILAGIGAITAQSVVDSGGNNRMFVRDGLLQGRALSSILADLSERDNGHTNRQYGMITSSGDVLTYSGIENADWAGGVTGRLERGRPGPLDDIVYCVQGNILSGPNVVPAAVDSIELAMGSDLPGMLMDSMLAARNAGGDGRCSCSQGNPTGCDDPIELPFKSAHIGYMIGSRLGDINTIRGFYSNDANARGATLVDIGNNGRDELAIASVDGIIYTYANGTGRLDQVSHLVESDTIDTGLDSLDTLVRADVNGDGLDDLAAIAGPSTLALLVQRPGGSFDPPITLDTGSEIRDLETIRDASSTRTDVLITVPDLGQTRRVTLDNTSLVSSVLLDTDAQSTSVRATDVNGDEHTDLLVTQRDADGLLIALGDGTGVYTPWITLTTGDQPQDVVVTDVNGDTVLDVVVLCDGAEQIQTFLGDTKGFGAPVNQGIDNDGVSLRVADYNADGTPDLLARMIDPGLFSTAHRERVLIGDGSGGFNETDSQRVSPSSPDAISVNLNPNFDDDPDTLVVSGSTVVVLDNDGSGEFPSGNGFAGGSHYMSFNIANQQAASPDPIDQMIEQFGMFRAGLMNKVDAVRSGVSVPPRLVTGRPERVRLDLRDWRGVGVDPSSVSFAFATIRGGAVATAPIKTAPGVYEFDIETMQESGSTELEIRINADGVNIVLMPRLRVNTTNILADLNADGVLDFADVSEFLRAIAANDPNGDLDNSGDTDTDDVQSFLDAFMDATTAQ